MRGEACTLIRNNYAAKGLPQRLCREGFAAKALENLITKVPALVHVFAGHRARPVLSELPTALNI